jgi:hypothetical protein
MAGDEKSTHSRPGKVILGKARSKAQLAALSRSGPQPTIASDVAYFAAREEIARGPLPDAMSQVGAGGELIPVEAFGYKPPDGLKDTVANPDYVALEASRDRLELANKAGCLEMALDATDTLRTTNSIEAMMAHQMAAAHNTIMKVGEQVNRSCERMEFCSDPERLEQHSITTSRLMGQMARLMTAYQSGALAIQNMRRGGKQTVVVQHVQVTEGGQAVVVGNVKGGGAGKRRGTCEK